MSNKEISGWLLESILNNIDNVTGSWDNGQKNNKAIMQLSKYRNGATGYHYNGINVISCWAHCMANKFNNNTYYTLNQCKQLNLTVMNDQIRNGNIIIYYMKSKIKDKKTGDEITIPFMRYTKVFNIDQIVDSPEKEKQLKKHNSNNVPVVSMNEKIEEIETIIKDYVKRSKTLDIIIESKNGIPYYQPSDDNISIPNITLFDSSNRYYESFIHEIIHSTGHVDRLNRKLLGMNNKSQYAFEELIAEFGLAFFCESNNVEYDFNNCLLYMKSWLKSLKDNPEHIVKAASKANYAVNYIMNNVRNTENETE